MDPTHLPLHDAVNRAFADEEIPDRLLRKAVELMLDRGIQVDEIAAKLLAWATIAACETNELDVWSAVFRQAGDAVAEWGNDPGSIGSAVSAADRSLVLD